MELRGGLDLPVHGSQDPGENFLYLGFSSGQNACSWQIRARPEAPRISIS